MNTYLPTLKQLQYWSELFPSPGREASHSGDGST
jgi:hypothetical protein